MASAKPQENRANASFFTINFSSEGFDVYAYDEKGEQLGWGYTCPVIKEAVNRKDMSLEKYSKVSIRDNATRKKTTMAINGVNKEWDFICFRSAGSWDVTHSIGDIEKKSCKPGRAWR